jgi:hypothetical protein
MFSNILANLTVAIIRVNDFGVIFDSSVSEVSTDKRNANQWSATTWLVRRRDAIVSATM